MTQRKTENTPPVRRFEPGASGMGLDDFLQRRGYAINFIGTGAAIKRTSSPGRAQSVTRKRLMEILDHHRVQEGLEPIVKRNQGT